LTILDPISRWPRAQHTMPLIKCSLASSLRCILLAFQCGTKECLGLTSFRSLLEISLSDPLNLLLSVTFAQHQCFVFTNCTSNLFEAGNAVLRLPGSSALLDESASSSLPNPRLLQCIV